MTTEEAQRLTGACAVVGPHPEEERLLHAEIHEIRLHKSGTADTYEVFFGDGTKGAFKSLEGSERNAASYGHTGASVLLNDLTASLVARGLGFEELVRGVVLRVAANEGVGIGSLQTWHDGEPSAPGWEGAGQLRSAALFDALIGQQDRNPTNFNYNPDSDELGLFDNSYSFALPGHQTSASVIVQTARDDDATLEDDLIDALNRFATSEERQMSEKLLEPERWTRLLARHEKMLETGELLEPFDF
jgi:hypothetical protein